ncbi:MAG TPA: carbohydrate-binding domain-containing protein [Ignavibacteriaceae bacterium]|nr:carbohydrate-binding domain-containing protein [Ignavibacteriaceae bacterium]
MKKLFLLFMVFSVISVFPQALNVVLQDGQSRLINISEISSLTFTNTLLETVNGNPEMVGANALHIYSNSIVTEIFVWHIDSIYFNTERTMAFFQTSTGLKEFEISAIDSIKFSNMLDSRVYITYLDSTVQVVNPYQDQGVSISVQGADVIVNSTGGLSGINYILSGSTSDGMFKVYSDKKLTIVMDSVQITNQDGPAVNIQSSKSITVYLAEGSINTLTDGLNYTAAPNNEDQKAAFFSEGQLVFSGTGELIINGIGADKHALASDDYIEINNGTIKINSAKKDGINVNDSFTMRGGSVNIKADGDGIDGGEGIMEFQNGDITILSTVEGKDAIKSTNNIVISSGNFDIKVQGNRSKGINSTLSVNITGGTLVFNTSGNTVLQASGSGYDPSYCTAIKADIDVNIESCNITINTSGQGARGISTDGNLTIKSGSVSVTSTGHGSTYVNSSGVADAYTGPCLKSNGRFFILDGTLTLTHSGKGGKGINVDGKVTIGSSETAPVINVTTTGQSILISTNNYAEAKAISSDSAITINNCNLTISSADDAIKSKDSITIINGTIVINQSFEGIEAPFLTINGGDITAFASDDCLNATMGDDQMFNDGSKLIINGGYIMVSASSGDAIDSNGDLYINGGTIIAHGPQSSPEVGVDVNGQFRVNGGFLIVSGTNSNMTQAPNSASTQRSVVLKTSSQITAGTLFHLEDASGNNLVTFAPKRRYYSIIFSSSQLTQGTSYKVFTGGSSTGTVQHGFYTGGTYSGGTLRKTFTLTSTVQTVTF